MENEARIGNYEKPRVTKDEFHFVTHHFSLFTIKYALRFNSDVEIFLDLSSLYDLTLFIISTLNVPRSTISKSLEFTHSDFNKSYSSLPLKFTHSSDMLDGLCYARPSVCKGEKDKDDFSQFL